MKMSEVIKEHGFGDPLNYEDCALGRTFRVVTGRSLIEASLVDKDYSVVDSPPGTAFRRAFAEAMNMPYEVVWGVEKLAIRGRSVEELVAYLEEHGC